MPEILAIRSRRAFSLAATLVFAASAAQAEVVFRGLEGPPLENVQAYLSLDELECEADRIDVRQEFAVVERDAIEALQALGYYNARLSTELSFDDDCWEAMIDVALGPQTTIRAFSFEVVGAGDDPVFERIASSPGIAAGDGLHHGRYEALKRRLLDAARDRGYQESELETSRLEVWAEENAADIAIRFVTGPRYRFGEVQVDQEALDLDFVERYIAIEPGEPFTNAALSTTYVALTDSGYFETIDVRALTPNSEARTIPVRITLVASPRLRINYGVGFSTDTGPRLRIGRDIRRFNVRGHQLGIQSQLSPVVSEVSANYRLPYGDPRFEWASFDGGVKREETETATSESLQFGARRVLERSRGWSRTQFVNLLVEDFDVSDQSGRSRLLMPGINWTRLRADNSLRPTRGEKLDIELRGAGDAFGSDTSFVQTVVDFKIIRSFGRGARLLARAKAGLTAEDSFADLPPSVRFFAGGDSSIRGYDFESLGPVDDDGDVIGGSSLLVGSVEYEYPVRPRWSVAAFVDSGNAFNSSDREIRTGAGIGARWQSPLGPVRVDIGVPVNDPDNGPRIHISLGPDL